MKTSHQFLVILGLLVAGCDGGSGSGPAPIQFAPTIAAISDQVITANAPSNAIGFTVSDEQPDSLAITASSDNQSIVPDSALEPGGTGTSRTLVVTPTVDTVDDAFITITVVDVQGLSASTSFLLMVEPEQRSFTNFVRTSFAALPNDNPSLINAVQFDQDAGNDDFADLIGQ